ncbi:MAG TPA: acetate--CoA ligase family protein [Micromonosporaceae bacterium]|nr:acetate--CoA ligase family protein [Micromonosporaceae bacterium]
MPRTLDALFDPASVAIVGASDDRTKWGYSVAAQALRAGDRRPVHLVNRRGGSILGRPAATSLTAIGEPVGLVVIAVPVASFEEAVDEALAVGARAIIGITAGFAELGAEGAARQAAIVERVRAAGAVLLGPNCLGLVDNTTRVYLSSDPFSDGGVALLSQSGNLALELELRLARHGLGFSRFVSFGNQADVSLVDLVADCARHERTSAIAVYAEDFADGRGFAVVAAEALSVYGKPVVLLTTGAGEASARGAASHTGALTTPTDVVAAACRDAGIHLVGTPRELTAVLASICAGRRSAGRRTAILTDGGGHGAIAADVAERAGLAVPMLSGALQEGIRGVLWAQSAIGNPVDLAGMGEQDPMSYAHALGTLLAADEVDAVLVTGFFGGYAVATDGWGAGALGDSERKAAAEIARLVTGTGKPVAVQSMYPESPSCRAIAESGTPVFGAVEDAAASLAAVTSSTRPRGFAALPLPSPLRRGSAAHRDPADHITRTTVNQAGEPAGPARLGYFESRDLLAAAGVRFAEAGEVTTETELRRAAAAIGGPYVLKALHLLHKSDGGGVVVDLPDVDALVAAYREMDARLRAPAYSVEAMADLREGIELIVGVTADPRFGPVAMVGIGGVYAEILRDVAYALSPVPVDLAMDLLLGLRGAALLAGARGRPAVDVDAAARAVALVTELAAAHPDIAEIEVNPLLATPTGALALDARVILA